ncbi:hypothetical protein J4Q44_G00083300 [Coregonus suidteri]|uniref:Uncharacterized protein n=1 Tax=Coregonus suidteri TaxID=861788 RepID=A0AAN8M3Q6_9TELE
MPAAMVTEKDPQVYGMGPAGLHGHLFPPLTQEMSEASPNDPNTSKAQGMSHSTLGVTPRLPPPKSAPCSPAPTAPDQTPRRYSNGGPSLPFPSSSTSGCYDNCATTRRMSVGAEPIWGCDPSQRRASQLGFVDTHCHLDMLWGKLGFRRTFARFRSLHQSSFPPEFQDFCNPQIIVREALWEGLLVEELHSLRKRSAWTTPTRTPSTHLGRKKEVFQRQLKVAVAMNKPLVIHCRDTDDDMLVIMKKCVPRDYKITVSPTVTQ